MRAAPGPSRGRASPRRASRRPSGVAAHRVARESGADERGRARREPRQRPHRVGRQHAIAIAKGTAAALTGSPSLLAETLHSLADAGNEVFLFIAIRRSRHPADASHPFGYGPERYYWALLAAIGMFVVGGAVSIWEGVRALVNPRGLEAFWAGVAVLVIAIVLDGISRVVAVRQLRTQSARRGLTVRSTRARRRTRRS